MVDVVLDFDGTCVDHRYPHIGPDVPGAVATLLAWTSELDVRIILSTMRPRGHLMPALEWFESHSIPLWAVQVHPEQVRWTDSPKCHGEFCVDDRNIGTPLQHVQGFYRPCVRWLDGKSPYGDLEILGVDSLLRLRLQEFA